MAVADDISAWRRTQRADLVARREAIPEELRRVWTERVTQWLVDGFSALEAAVIGFCWPFRGEVDTRAFIYAMRKRGARAALPAVVATKAPLEFREWWPGVAMAPGVFDLPVPQGTALVHPDALLIPPVGFSEQGHRLGYGGGYFDRTLAAMQPQPLKIGVAFELSRMDTIRPQPHDIPMDFVVTERGVHEVTSQGLERICAISAVREAVARLLRERAFSRGA